jgi:hypothetical protein
MTKEGDKCERGGFVLTFEPGHSETVDAALRFRKREATETFSAKDWKLHHKELVLVSFSLEHEYGRDRTIDGARASPWSARAARYRYALPARKRCTTS